MQQEDSFVVVILFFYCLIDVTDFVHAGLKHVSYGILLGLEFVNGRSETDYAPLN